MLASKKVLELVKQYSEYFIELRDKPPINDRSEKKSNLSSLTSQTLIPEQRDKTL